MDNQIRFNYEDYEKHYQKLLKDGWPKSENYLCLMDDGKFGYYSKSQKGYTMAVKKQVVPADKVCMECGQEVPVPEPIVTREMISAKTATYRKHLEKKYL